MPATEDPYLPARYNHVPEQTEPLRMSQCWMRWPEWPKRVAPEIIAGGTGKLADYDSLETQIGERRAEVQTARRPKRFTH